MSLPIIFISTDQILIDQAIVEVLQLYGMSMDHPDVLVIQEKIGVAQVKIIASHLLIQASGKFKKIVVLNPIESWSTDAQNGLLKMLEEPVGDAIFLLGIKDVSEILDTILSRCELRYLPSQPIILSQTDQIKDLLALDMEKRLELTNLWENKAEFIDQLAGYYHQKLIQSPNHAQSLKTILDAKRWIRQNVSAKAVFDFLMISLPLEKIQSV